MLDPTGSPVTTQGILVCGGKRLLLKTLKERTRDLNAEAGHRGGIACCGNPTLQLWEKSGSARTGDRDGILCQLCTCAQLEPARNGEPCLKPEANHLSRSVSPSSSMNASTTSRRDDLTIPELFSVLKQRLCDISSNCIRCAPSLSFGGKSVK